MELRLPGGPAWAGPPGTRVGEVLQALGVTMGSDAVLAGEVGGLTVGLGEALGEGGEREIRPLTFADEGGRDAYRHTASHVLAHAVVRLFPGTILGIGPAISDGFYYDFLRSEVFTPEDLPRIEAEMKAIVAADLPLERMVMGRDEAIRLFELRGERFKVELIRGLEPEVPIILYRQGDFVDLCAGPHLPSTGWLKAFKLLSLAGAYWRGDERREQLQRIYGTAYPDSEGLERHLVRLEEARRRDHRVLGRELELFSLHEEAGAGLAFWHPRGGRLRQIIEDFWRAEHRRRGYEILFTPHIARADLWATSGHLGWYKDSLYSPMDIDGVDYLLKPMNCPFHLLIYKSRTRSYRELPLRWGELGTVYRYERSGVLHGLLRVRGFTQDDAHIFCRPDQLEDELHGIVDLARFMLRSFGFSEFEVALSVRDPANKQKYLGSDEDWDRAEAALESALRRHGLPFRREEGEAVFYAPKIDIKLIDALGRGWQGPTIQVDFNLPERFDVTYTGEDGRPHRPFMIHRTVLGSMERFLACLVEHHAGAFPFWLAPVQAKVLPITTRQLDYAGTVAERLTRSGFRAEVDTRSEKIGYKIRAAQLEKVPYMLVVGDREAAAGTVAVRERQGGDRGAMTLEEFLSLIATQGTPVA
ncbi:MAG TPA: threonine--tRNA ligase [Clostridiales bacterium]|nr:threonine--tRNA ligase [Clostridiales bacterium]